MIRAENRGPEKRTHAKGASGPHSGAPFSWFKWLFTNELSNTCYNLDGYCMSALPLPWLEYGRTGSKCDIVSL